MTGLSLRVRLFVSLGALVLPLVALGAVQLLGQERAVQRTSALVREVSTEGTLVALAREEVAAAQAAAADLASTADPTARGRYRTAARRAGSRLPPLTRLDEPDERRLGRDALAAWQRADRAANRALDRQTRGGLRLDAFHAHVLRTHRNLSALLESGFRELDEETTAVRADERQRLLALVMLLVASALGAVLLARQLHRRIHRPLQSLREGARRLGGGDLSYRVTTGPDPEFIHVADAFNEMRERLTASHRELEHQAFHDELTGLPNRLLLFDRVTHALARATREDAEQCTVAVLFVDLDDFKTVNDSLGHSAGDELLVEVAGRLRACVRPQDTVARLGGDEFAILLEDIDGDDARRVADRTLLALSAPALVGTHELQPHASIGVALGDKRLGAEDLLRNADVAMYEAKAQGKASYRTFAASMAEGNVERLRLAAELRHAVETGCHDFELHYQPIHDLPTGGLVGIEALVRWRHQRGLVSPDEFIPVAERTGLIVPLGRWVLREACRRIRQLQAAHHDSQHLSVSVNLSARQLRDPGLVGDVAQALRVADLDPRALTLELTESMLMTDIETSVAQMTELKALGVRLAVDDFGTGYSSLGYLRQFPVDVLKVDKRFIDGVAEPHSNDQGLVRSIIALCHTLGLTTVAEGIEHPEQRRTLQQLGCELGQGFLLARPMSADALHDYIERTAKTAQPGPLDVTRSGHVGAGLRSLPPRS